MIRSPDRTAAALGVVSIHVAAALALAGWGRDTPAPEPANPLKLFEIRAEAPPQPPPPPPPPPPRAREEERAPAPPGPVAAPAPAPRPAEQLRVDLPQLAAAPLSAPAEPGTGTAAAGTGGGQGGSGAGGGTGGAGTGSGAGDGPPVRTRRIRGHFTSADYPRAAERIGAEGTVAARLAIGPNGRVADCRIRVSSGNADLDAATCAIILRRFRFEPARDAAGRAVADAVEWQQIWSLQPEDRPETAQAMCRAEAEAAGGSVSTRRARFTACMAALGWTR